MNWAPPVWSSSRLYQPLWSGPGVDDITGFYSYSFYICLFLLYLKTVLNIGKSQIDWFMISCSRAVASFSTHTDPYGNTWRFQFKHYLRTDWESNRKFSLLLWSTLEIFWLYFRVMGKMTNNLNFRIKDFSPPVEYRLPSVDLILKSSSIHLSGNNSLPRNTNFCYKSWENLKLK